MQWETVIGLEVHIQLATRAKLFSSSPVVFGAPPNAHASAIDAALPGTLPQLNEEALDMALMFGLAIGSKIDKVSLFERKSYFYPDLPKGYQTTQLQQPVVGAGQIDVALPDGEVRSVRIHHAHLEEDAGKSVHDSFHAQTAIDLNRAGTALLEVVTEPDMRSAVEAVSFARALHSQVTHLEICDGDLSQGSIRFDVNVSVRRRGAQALGVRTETKNLNSFRFMEQAINKEVARQIDLLESGGQVVQQTRLYNGDTGVSQAMRSKEEANDYRYFPCPDLLPVVVDEQRLQRLRQRLPESPKLRKERFMEQWGLSDYAAQTLAAERATATYFEKAAERCQNATLVANWVMGELMRQLNDHQLAIEQSPVGATVLAELLRRIEDKTLSTTAARQVFRTLWQEEGREVDSVIEQYGFRQVTDTEAIDAIVKQVLANHSAQVEDYRRCDAVKQKKMFGFFIGQTMKAGKGSICPATARQCLLSRLDQASGSEAAEAD